MDLDLLLCSFEGCGRFNIIWDLPSFYLFKLILVNAKIINNLINNHKFNHIKLI